MTNLYQRHIQYIQQQQLQRKYMDLETKYKQLCNEYYYVEPLELITDMNRSSPTSYYNKKVMNVIIALLFRRSEYYFYRKESSQITGNWDKKWYKN